MVFFHRYRFHDPGLLLLRAGRGVIFVLHGYPRRARGLGGNQRRDGHGGTGVYARVLRLAGGAG